MSEISNTDRPDASPLPEPAQLTLFPAPASPAPATVAAAETSKKPDSAQALRETLNELLAPYRMKHGSDIKCGCRLR